MEKETLFTKIIKREIPASIIYEDENTLAILDINPFEKGHTLVIPKKPYETIMQMPEKEFLELMKIVKKIADHYEKTLDCGTGVDAASIRGPSAAVSRENAGADQGEVRLRRGGRRPGPV